MQSIIFLSLYQLVSLNLLELTFTPVNVSSTCSRVSGSCVSIINETWDMFGIHCMLPTSCGAEVRKQTINTGFLSNTYICSRALPVRNILAYKIEFFLQFHIFPGYGRDSSIRQSVLYRNDSNQHCFNSIEYINHCDGIPNICSDGRTLMTVPLSALEWRCADTFLDALKLLPFLFSFERTGALLDSCPVNHIESAIHFNFSTRKGKIESAAENVYVKWVKGDNGTTVQLVVQKYANLVARVTGEVVLLSTFVGNGVYKRRWQGTEDYLITPSVVLINEGIGVQDNFHNGFLCGLYKPLFDYHYFPFAHNSTHYVHRGEIHAFEHHCTTGLRILTDKMGILAGLMVILEFLTYLIIYVINSLSTVFFELFSSAEDVLHYLIDTLADLSRMILIVFLDRVFYSLNAKFAIMIIIFPLFSARLGITYTVFIVMGVYAIDVILNPNFQ